MDYRNLLKKYMQHIIDCESVSYLGTYATVEPEVGRISSTVIFTPVEMKVLEAIEDETKVT